MTKYYKLLEECCHSQYLSNKKSITEWFYSINDFDSSAPYFYVTIMEIFWARINFGKKYWFFGTHIFNFYVVVIRFIKKKLIN